MVLQVSVLMSFKLNLEIGLSILTIFLQQTIDFREILSSQSGSHLRDTYVKLYENRRKAYF